jgi:hypothetical protein
MIGRQAAVFHAQLPTNFATDPKIGAGNRSGSSDNLCGDEHIWMDQSFAERR